MVRYSLIALLGSLALQACGSSSNGSLYQGKSASGDGGGPGAGGVLPVIVPGAGGGGATPTGGGPSGGGSGGLLLAAGGSPGAPDAATGGFATLDASPPRDGGPQPTPGEIFCGGSPCLIAGTPTNTCCAAPLPFPIQCTPSFPGCVTGGFAIACDDRADCLNGQRCCGSFGSTTSGASCANDCSAFMFQLCRVDEECDFGQRCRPLAASPDYSICQ